MNSAYLNHSMTQAEGTPDTDMSRHHSVSDSFVGSCFRMPEIIAFSNSNRSSTTILPCINLSCSRRFTWTSRLRLASQGVILGLSIGPSHRTTPGSFVARPLKPRKKIPSAGRLHSIHPNKPHPVHSLPHTIHPPFMPTHPNHHVFLTLMIQAMKIIGPLIQGTHLARRMLCFTLTSYKSS